MLADRFNQKPPFDTLALKRTSILYLLMMTLIAGPMVWLLHSGSALLGPARLVDKPGVQQPAESGFEALISAASQNLADPLSRLFLQLVIIIAATRMTARVIAIFGQPPVVGEMAAGILLGPSLFGILLLARLRFFFLRPRLVCSSY